MPSVKNSFSFLFISVANTIGWNALITNITAFQSKFGNQVLLQMTWAFFAPALPVLWLSTQIDHKLDRRFGVYRCTQWRLLTSQALITAIVCAFPLYPPNGLGLTSLLLSLVVLGLAAGVAFATSYRIVSLFPAYCTVALTVGFSGSGPLVMLAVFLIGESESFGSQITLYFFCASVALIGLACSYWVLDRNRWRFEDGGVRPQRAPAAAAAAAARGVAPGAQSGVAGSDSRLREPLLGVEGRAGAEGGGMSRESSSRRGARGGPAAPRRLAHSMSLGSSLSRGAAPALSDDDYDLPAVPYFNTYTAGLGLFDAALSVTAHDFRTAFSPLSSSSTTTTPSRSSSRNLNQGPTFRRVHSELKRERNDRSNGNGARSPLGNGGTGGTNPNPYPHPAVHPLGYGYVHPARRPPRVASAGTIASESSSIPPGATGTAISDPEAAAAAAAADNTINLSPRVSVPQRPPLPAHPRTLDLSGTSPDLTSELSGLSDVEGTAAVAIPQPSSTPNITAGCFGTPIELPHADQLEFPSVHSDDTFHSGYITEIEGGSGRRRTEGGPSPRAGPPRPFGPSRPARLLPAPVPEADEHHEHASNPSYDASPEEGRGAGGAAAPRGAAMYARSSGRSSHGGDDESDMEAGLGLGPMRAPPVRLPALVTTQELVDRIWHCALALALNAISTFLVFPFFTYVPSDGLLGRQLPKALFFVKISFDLVGRALPNIPSLVLRSGRLLLAIACAKAALTGLFFSYLLLAGSPGGGQYLNDLGAMWFVAVFWTLAGFISSNSYMLAPRKAIKGGDPRRDLGARAGSMMAFTHQTCCLVGLILAVVLQQINFTSTDEMRS